MQKVKIQGKCPYCKTDDSVVFVDHYYAGESAHYTGLPTCRNCGNDEIRVRKINNRRYKVDEVQWEE